MQIYKDTLALEACPTKTAETVSYGATFAVLGWLLLSNYSGIGLAEQAIASAEPQPADSFAPQVLTVNGTAALLAGQTRNERPPTAEVLAQPVAENSNFTTAPPAWHANLDSYQRYDSQAHFRAFSTDDWKARTNDSVRQIAEFMDGLVLPLPLIDTADLFDGSATFNIANNGKLTNKQDSETGLIRSITVTSAEANRLTNRPDNIRRPQIPRPYRAQEIQRSFLLPPRIQALRP